MKTAVAAALEQLSLGEPQSFEHLALIPLLCEPTATPGYLMLREALAAGQCRVTEVSESGSVPELLLDNPSTHRILLLEGDELVGARQNRVLNVTILVAPGSRLSIPVSCVERGRWSYRSREFVSEDRMMFAGARAEKIAQVSHSVRTGGTRRSNQGAVWNQVHAKAAQFNVCAPTEAMSDVYRHLSRDLARHRAAFSAVEGQRGALFAIDGRVVGLELFDAPAPFRSALGRLVGSYALDAMGSRRHAFPAPDPAAAKAYLVRVDAARALAAPSVGLGVEVRLEATGLVGEALVVDDRLVHLSALEASTDDGELGSLSSRVASRRRWQA